MVVLASGGGLKVASRGFHLGVRWRGDWKSSLIPSHCHGVATIGSLSRRILAKTDGHGLMGDTGNRLHRCGAERMVVVWSLRLSSRSSELADGGTSHFKITPIPFQETGYFKIELIGEA